MTTRRLEISNYRNLGIGKPITFNLDVLGEGDLIILIGENNIGKSNVIAALKALGNKSLQESDKPIF